MAVHALSITKSYSLTLTFKTTKVAYMRPVTGLILLHRKFSYVIREYLELTTM